MVGFARYRDSTLPGALNSTDNQWQANAGAVRHLTPRLDAVVDYNYSQYGVEGGKYNPKNFNIGVLFHLVKR
jgi:predicted porin